MADTQTALPRFSDPLLARFFLTPEEKASKEVGKEIIQAFYKANTANDTLNYWQGRRVRQILLQLWAKGSQNMTEFLSFLNISDANKSLSNVDLTQSRIAPQFVNTVIEAMAKNQIYPCVTAIDDASIGEKNERMFEALFRMHEVQTINDVQQQAGIQMEPTNAYVPDDEMSARVYFKLEDQLPKEIKFEELLKYVQNAIKFDTIMNRKTIHDLVVVNTGIIKIEKLGVGDYTVRKCIVNNMVWDFFMNDNGDAEIKKIGEFYSLKVADFRSRFGQSADRPDGLTEKEIYDLAKLSTNKNIGSMSWNFNWQDMWGMSNYTQTRPYDDRNILVFDCEIDCGEDQYFVNKKDAFGKDNLTAKTATPYKQFKKNGDIIEQPKPDNVEIIKTTKNTWMRGVYAPYGDKMLYWGRPDLIITPFTNVAKPLSSYCINIPGNDGEYVPSLFERGMDVLKEYQLVKLRRKQMIAKLPLPGYKVDVENARNLDLGNGDTIDWLEVVQIKDNSGVEVWTSKGIDPLKTEGSPFSPATPDDTVNKIIGLTQVLQGLLGELRMLYGASVYLEGGDLGDRTAAKLAENQTENANNVFGYVLNGNNQLWEEAFYKICLLHWNDIVKQEPEDKNDMINTRFEVKVKMKSSDYEREQLEADIQRFSQVPDAQGNPSLTPKDAFYLREIEDGKLAKWYLSTTWDKNRKDAIADKQRDVENNAMQQQQSAQQAAAQQQQLQAEKIQQEKDMLNFKFNQEKQLGFLNGALMVAAKGIPLPPAWNDALNQIIPNIVIPLTAENQQMQDAIIAQKHHELASQYADQQTSQEQNEQPQQEQQEGAQSPQQEQQEQPSQPQMQQ